ncbi:MAG: cytochrome c3 family protein, partial [Melioribacteraceae bacterium]|nr:cytochrome c3 family protein [Melioribacteraceae bacterium]
SAGTVTFPHLYHYEDEGIECVECHHEMNAQNIDIPHEEYFEDFWIDCGVCHSNNVEGEIVAHACSDCHNSNPSNIADEMISKKVAIHINCWECHEVGTGVEASESCEYCHIRE